MVNFAIRTNQLSYLEEECATCSDLLGNWRLSKLRATAQAIYTSHSKLEIKRKEAGETRKRAVRERQKHTCQAQAPGPEHLCSNCRTGRQRGDAGRHYSEGGDASQAFVLLRAKRETKTQGDYLHDMEWAKSIRQNLTNLKNWMN